MQARQNTEDYLPLFLNDASLIDTRAPVEFAQGSFPNTVNLPLMSDEQRAQVGTEYKKNGQQSAIALGHELVHGAAKDALINAWKNFAEQNPNGYLFCFRGGLRSQISQQWLSEVGCDYPRVIGGYKAMRQYLLQSLPVSLQQGPVLVLSGQTGCAKTQLLQSVPHAIDLEGLANHRGSAFGKHVHGQPSQINFENAVAITLLKRRNVSVQKTIVLEDESHLIGRNVLPEALLGAMQKAPIAMIEMPLEQRVQHTYQNYILHKLQEWQEFSGLEQGFGYFADELLASLDSLKRRLGGWRYQQLQTQMQNALISHLHGNSEQHMQWIRALLNDYYDPMYQYQLSKKSDRIIFRGSYEEVEQFLQHNTLTQFHEGKTDAT
jgi:tRNA 2-selenouridine synthase